MSVPRARLPGQRFALWCLTAVKRARNQAYTTGAELLNWVTMNRDVFAAPARQSQSPSGCPPSSYAFLPELSQLPEAADAETKMTASARDPHAWPAAAPQGQQRGGPRRRGGRVRRQTLSSTRTSSSASSRTRAIKTAFQRYSAWGAACCAALPSSSSSMHTSREFDGIFMALAAWALTYPAQSCRLRAALKHAVPAWGGLCLGLTCMLHEECALVALYTRAVGEQRQKFTLDAQPYVATTFPWSSFTLQRAAARSISDRSRCRVEAPVDGLLISDPAAKASEWAREGKRGIRAIGEREREKEGGLTCGGLGDCHWRRSPGSF